MLTVRVVLNDGTKKDFDYFFPDNPELFDHTTHVTVIDTVYHSSYIGEPFHVVRGNTKVTVEHINPQHTWIIKAMGNDLEEVEKLYWEAQKRLGMKFITDSLHLPNLSGFWQRLRWLTRWLLNGQLVD